jgi:hypothetical protein
MLTLDADQEPPVAALLGLIISDVEFVAAIHYGVIFFYVREVLVDQASKIESIYPVDLLFASR